MKKLKELFEQYKPVIILIAKSRTMQGIVAMAIGTVIAYAKAHFPQPVLNLCGEYITYSAASLQAAGLGWAFYGRMNASGPISTTGQGPGIKATAFDGTVGELP